MASGGQLETPPAIEPPATLLWIGPRRHRELLDCWRFCCQHAGQIAWRPSIAAALRRPAGHVRRILLARLVRAQPPPRLWHRLLQQYTAPQQDTAILALLGSLCDGGARSEPPWPCPSIRFSRWQEVLPQWLQPCGADVAPIIPPRSLLVLADRFDTAEPLLDAADHAGIVATWQRRYLPSLHRGFEMVLWDDSVWTQSALNRSTTPRPAPMVGNGRHVWLVLQPSAEAIQRSRQAGFDSVWSKPLRIDQLLGAAPPR